MLGPNVWNVRCTIEHQLSATLEFQCHRFIFQIVYPLEIQLLSFIFSAPYLRIEIIIMISSNDNLLTVWQ